MVDEGGLCIPHELLWYVGSFLALQMGSKSRLYLVPIEAFTVVQRQPCWAMITQRLISPSSLKKCSLELREDLLLDMQRAWPCCW